MVTGWSRKLVRRDRRKTEPDAGQGRDLVDVYEAFEGICRDEDAFREELARYALPDNGDRPITPIDIPPLVATHLEWIRPTSRNKMFNAEITFRAEHQWQEVGQPVADQLQQAITTARRGIDRLESEELIQRLDSLQTAPEMGFAIER